MANNYNIEKKIRNPKIRELMEDIMDITAGHSHDGVDSRSVNAGTPADNSITNAKVAAGANIDAAKLGTGVVSNTEFNYLNGVTSSIQDQLDAVSASDIADGTPVNAVASQGTLTLSGVVIDGETVTINGVDVYEFCADAAQSLTGGSTIAVDIQAYVDASQGTLTVDTQPTSGDTMTIDAKVFTFVPVGTANADGEISVGADLAGAQAAIVAAVNGTDGVNDPHPSVSIAAFAANAAVLTALVGGVAGDSIATTETFTAGTNVFDAATLGTTTAGADCSAANGVTALVGAITASDTQGVGAADGAGDTVVLTADVKGTAGDAITTTEAMANGAFDAATLGTTTAGVDGTVGNSGKLYKDSSYLYIAIAANTIADANWRRISVGAAY